MIGRFNRRLLNFLMSGWFFDEKKSKKNDDEGNVYESKMDYVGNVAKFLEDGVKEMTKDIK
ncbi:MAG TPA: hypothetical protein VJ892_00705, partial [Candidatus Absconditabacterales bacterium]|nr:hypothetical protein [Candidatus Absconditabacterales bacterium]